MTLEQRIDADLTAAIKGGDTARKDLLRLLRSALKNATIESRQVLDDAAVLAVLQKQAKQRRDSIVHFEMGGRADLTAIEQAELAIIESYLPRQLDESEVEAIVRRHLAALGPIGPTEMAKIMPPVMAEVAGLADGKMVSAVVRRVLAG